ncbi:MAG TPA: hypothetical protein VIE65_10890, partial [Methylobacter sp.]
MTSTKWEAKLNLPFTASAPDVFISTIGQRPSSDFVISRHRDATIASIYSDVSWNLTTWHTDGVRTIVSFDFWKHEPVSPERKSLAADAKWLMFSLIWMRDGAPLNVNTFTIYHYLISALARYADEVSSTIPNLLSQEALLREFVDAGSSDARTVHLSALVSHLLRIGEFVLGFGIVGRKMRHYLKTRATAYKADHIQYAPFPSRIYSEILSNLDQELNDWERVASTYLKLLADCARDRLYGRGNKTQRNLAKRGGVTWEKRPQWNEVAPSSVRAYLRSKNLTDSVIGLAAGITNIQLLAKLTIQAYSGMRDNESRTLPFDCLDSLVSGGKRRLLIQGSTTKLATGIRRTAWVTNREGHRAIQVAKDIATTIYAACSIRLDEKRIDQTTTGGCPLFVSVSYTSMGCSHRPATANFFQPTQLKLEQFHNLLSRLQPL